MQVSSHSNIQQNRIPEMTQEQRDNARGLATDVAAKNSKEAQIEMYVKGSQQASDDFSYSNNSDYITDYTDFAKDVQRSNNYQTIVENDGLENIPRDGATIQPVNSSIPEMSQEQKDSARETLVGVVANNSQKSQIEAYAAGAQNTNSDESSSMSSMEESIQNYNEFAAAARRSQNINIYIQNQ